MHRRVVNELTVDLVLWPTGPLLVKAAGLGADPTRPEVEFVRTRRDGLETPYLPGSSLKGALRAQCERIARTVGGTGLDGRPRLSCNPLTNAADGPNFSCNRRLVDVASQARGRELGGQRAYRESCAVCRLFGSVAEGPFNYEVVTAGRFATRLTLHNFTLAQVGLLALALRDLAESRFALGAGKSRG